MNSEILNGFLGKIKKGVFNFPLSYLQIHLYLLPVSEEAGVFVKDKLF